MIVTVEDAAGELKELIQRALDGEEVVITGKAGETAVKLVPVASQPRQRPQFGRFAGMAPPMDLERFRPLTDEELRAEGFELCVPDDR